VNQFSSHSDLLSAFTTETRRHGDFTEASGFSVHLRVLRVSVVNRRLNSSRAWLPPKLVGLVMAYRTISPGKSRRELIATRFLGCNRKRIFFRSDEFSFRQGHNQNVLVTVRVFASLW